MTLRNLLMILLTPALSTGAVLTQETINAWDSHMQAAKSGLHDRIRTGHFLWMDESTDRVQRVRQGEVVVSPVGDHHLKHVPDGLIHDWIGGAFIPGVTVDEVLTVVRNYEGYKDYYSPSVVDSRTLEQGPVNDRFSVTFLNKAMFLATALDTEYDSSYVQVDQKRWYSLSCSTRVQQIERYREADEHKLPPDLGNGYIWRLCSISKFQERDGGVYVELEAMALSRSIPAGLHWVVDPIVTRLSRNSMLVSLRQSRDAVRSLEVARMQTVRPTLVASAP